MAIELVAAHRETPFALFEHRGWQSVAGEYHAAWGHVTGPFALPLLEAAEIAKGLRVLDVGTGPGYAAAMAAAAGANVVGLDFSQAMIDEARQLHRDVDFRVGDVHDLEFASGSFDRVFSNFGVQHFSNLEAAFSEIGCVLRRGGLWAFSLWAADSLNKAGEVLNSALSRHARGARSVPEGPDYHQLDEDIALAALLADAGFNPHSVRRQSIEFIWQLESPDELFHSELVGSVRSGARLRDQSRSTRESIRMDMAQQILETYATPHGFALPMAASIVTVRKE